MLFNIGTEIQDCKERIKSCIERNNGTIHISYSGGKDSQVVLYLCRKFFPNTKRVLHISAELFYPEVGAIIQKERLTELSLGNEVIIEKVRNNIFDIINKYGVFCFDKQVSEMIKVLMRNSFQSQDTKEKRINWLRNIKNGKYNKLIDDILNGSFKYKWSGAYCCRLIKKSKTKNKNWTLTGLRRVESASRKKTKCVNEKLKSINCIVDWDNTLLHNFINENNIPIASCYSWTKRTGCICCPYSLQSKKNWDRKMEKYPTIMNRLKNETPLYNFLMEYVWRKDNELNI